MSEQLFQWSIARSIPHHPIILSLLKRTHHMIVLPGISVIVISQFRHILDSPMRLLEHRQANGDIIGGTEIVPPLIP